MLRGALFIFFFFYKLTAPNVLDIETLTTQSLIHFGELIRNFFIFLQNKLWVSFNIQESVIERMRKRENRVRRMCVGS